MSDRCRECGVLKEGFFAHKPGCETGRREIGAIFSRNPFFSSEPAAAQDTALTGRSRSPNGSGIPAPAAGPDAQTPRTDAAWKNEVHTASGAVDLSAAINLSRQLERENADLRRELAEAKTWGNRQMMGKQREMECAEAAEADAREMWEALSKLRRHTMCIECTAYAKDTLEKHRAKYGREG